MVRKRGIGLSRNPATEEQTIQRAHRFGRENVLYVVCFLVVNSVEERIIKGLDEKRGLFE